MQWSELVDVVIMIECRLGLVYNNLVWFYSSIGHVLLNVPIIYNGIHMYLPTYAWCIDNFSQFYACIGMQFKNE